MDQEGGVKVLVPMAVWGQGVGVKRFVVKVLIRRWGAIVREL